MEAVEANKVNRKSVDWRSCNKNRSIASSITKGYLLLEGGGLLGPESLTIWQVLYSKSKFACSKTSWQQAEKRKVQILDLAQESVTRPALR